MSEKLGQPTDCLKDMPTYPPHLTYFVKTFTLLFALNDFSVQSMKLLHDDRCAFDFLDYCDILVAMRFEREKHND